MKVVSATFVKSAARPDQYPRDGHPEIAFAGRSNVGKSTLLNTLLKSKGLAKTSGTPGKTRTINFFEVNGAFYCVDLPGYGYAKVAKSIKERWNRQMMGYLGKREALRMVVALVDARHEPTEKDLHLLDILDGGGVPTLVVATKIDKVKRNQRKQYLERIRRTLQLDEDALVLPFSAVTGEGVRELWGIICDRL